MLSEYLTRFLLVSLIILLSHTASAQTKVVGIVYDSTDSAAIAGVSAKITDSRGKVRKFAVTRADGIFSLSFPAADSLVLQLAKMGYAPKSVPVSSIGSDTLKIALEVQAVQLQEVGVRAKRIREQGDTITYTVGQFARTQDRSIGEVMNRMPGLEVDAVGNVQYQGTDINRLYVDGNDVAGKGYGVVTKNLDAENVGAVEVMENHQPMQVLRGISYSDQAAVNLRLKEKARIKVMGHGNAGGGYGRNPGGLYDADLFTMSMRGTVQNITTLRFSNTGHALGSLTGYYGDDDGESLPGYISAGGVSGGGNSVFNRSASFSTTTSWKNKKGGQWRMQANYGYDHLWSDRSSTTTYFLPDGDRIISEDRHADSRGHIGGIIANYELNEKSYFLNNNFSASLSLTDSRLAIAGTLPNNQHSHDYNYDISNRLKVICRFGGNKIITFNSVNKWLNRPEGLRVAADSADIGRRYAGNVSQHAFFTDERASFGFLIRRVAVTMETGASAFIRHLSSDLKGNLPLEGHEANDMNTDYIRLFVQPKFELNLRRLHLNFSVPLSYYTYFFGGALQNRSEFFAAPRAAVQWKPASRHTLNFEASARRSPASLAKIFSHDILTDYRTFRAGIDDYYSSTGQRLSLRWEWRNALRGWFANASISQGWNRDKFGVGQTVIGDYVVNTFHASPSSNESTDVGGRISRSIDFMNSTLCLDASYSRASGRYYSQNNPVERHSRSLLISPSLDMQFLQWLSGRYSFAFNRSDMRLSEMQPAAMDSYIHSFNLSASPRRWVFLVDGRHTRTELAPGHYDNRLTLNAEVRRSISRRWEVNLTARNLTDSRFLVSRRFDSLSSYESFIRLRGREFMLSVRYSL